MIINEAQLDGMQQEIKDCLRLVLPKLQEMNYIPEEIKKSTDIFGRIRDLGLQNVLKKASEEQKLVAKFSVKDILFAALVKPLFSGSYGLVIIPKGIVSRDFGEIRKTVLGRP